MKTLVQLAIVGLLGHAAFRVGTEYLTYYTFQDAVHEAVRFGPRDEGALRTKVMDLANSYAVPLEAEDLTVARADRSVHVEVRYRTAVELLPQVRRDWRFAWAFDVVQTGSGLR